MAARAGDSLQHASTCFAGPIMSSPFSLRESGAVCEWEEGKEGSDRREIRHQ
jgi:hypothetical protein